MARDLRHLLEPVSLKKAVVQRPPAVLPKAHRFRVFYYKHVFRCGLCGKAYSTEGLAWVCVAACAAEEMETLRVEENIASERADFQCPMCLRRFLNVQDANICFERCRDAALAHLPAEAMRLAVVSAPGERPEALRGQELQRKDIQKAASRKVGAPPAVPQPRELPTLLDLVPVPEGASLELLTVATEEESAGGLEKVATMGQAEDDVPWLPPAPPPVAEVPPPEPPPQEPAAEAPPPPTEPAVDEDPYTRVIGQKPFVRDGARYVCTSCKSKYFTKNEVEKCFEKHRLIIEEDE